MHILYSNSYNKTLGNDMGNPDRFILDRTHVPMLYGICHDRPVFHGRHSRLRNGEATPPTSEVIFPEDEILPVPWGKAILWWRRSHSLQICQQIRGMDGTQYLYYILTEESGINFRGRKDCRILGLDNLICFCFEQIQLSTSTTDVTGETLRPNTNPGMEYSYSRKDPSEIKGRFTKAKRSKTNPYDYRRYHYGKERIPQREKF